MKKSELKLLIKEIIFEEALSSNYRAVNNFLGNNVIFKPNGYYEEIGDDENPVFRKSTGLIYNRSNIPEIAASKYIGGCILGIWSMANNQTNSTKLSTVYIYKIKEHPDKDLSHWSSGDFEWLKEVRFRKAVEGAYVGEYTFTVEDNKKFRIFYDVISMDDSDYIEDIDDEEWKEMKEVVNNMHQYLLEKSI